MDGYKGKSHLEMDYEQGYPYDSGNPHIIFHRFSQHSTFPSPHGIFSGIHLFSAAHLVAPCRPPKESLQSACEGATFMTTLRKPGSFLCFRDFTVVSCGWGDVGRCGRKKTPQLVFVGKCQSKIRMMTGLQWNDIHHIPSYTWFISWKIPI